MSDMKCPFCNRNLHKGEDSIYSHLDYMTECKARLFDGSKELWQELICTRKALDVAVDALEMIGSGDIIEHSVVGHENDNKIFIANKALNEIKTALEQKDHFADTSKMVEQKE